MAQINIHKHVEKEQRKIGPIKKGALHAEMHVPKGTKIGRARLEREKAIAKREGNPTLEKRVQFALNFAH